MSAREPITMPKLGLTMQEGLLASWLVKPGSSVRRGDVMFIVETDKIANEIEATEDGKIGEILVPEGETVPVGAVLARWGEAAGQGGETPARTAGANLAPLPAEGARTISTPLARRLARQAGIDIRSVRGSGSRGRVMAADVHAHKQHSAAPPAQTLGPPAESPASGASTVPATRPLSRVRKLTAQRLALSKQTIPHFYVMTEADITSLESLRGQLNDMDGAPRLSINLLIVYAVGKALAAMPEMNAVWGDETVQPLESIDVGIAVEMKAGVMAPVLRGVGSMSLDEAADAASRLIAAARDGKLTSEDVSGGAITVSNTGMYGASYLVPIINPGQSIILGVGALKKVFRPDEQGAPKLASEIGLVLSCDHRAFDGVAAAKFLNKIRTYLEKPLALLRSAS